MLSRLFRAHGLFCAHRPWEVIIGTVTLTVCLISMSLFATDKVCGWNYDCHDDNTDVKSSDVIILTITRCLAVMYVYLQFRNLRNLGSKYLLGIAGVFTIFSSFVFSIAVINLIGGDLTGLNEALPFFLLLIDLSKACALARFALSSTSQDEVRDNIARGMAIIGPVITLDAFVQIMLIGVGTLSGVKVLETMCCFGCLSVFANYLAFMTFYPASLTLVLELSRNKNEGKPPVWQLNQLSKVLEEEEQKPNPVTQRVKIIMSAGLVLVHAHSRFVSESTGADPSSPFDDALNHYKTPETSLLWYYITMAMPPSIDYSITMGLAVVLALKYIWFDSDQGVETDLHIKENGRAPAEIQTEEGMEPVTQSEIRSRVEELKREGSVGTFTSTSSFIIGGESSDESDDDLVHVSSSQMKIVPTTHAETQTDKEKVVTVENRYDGPSRPMEELVQILKSDEGPSVLSDEEVQLLVTAKHIPSYKLESILGDHVRGVDIRRQMLSKLLSIPTSLDRVPYMNYDYKYVEGACCENVLGYIPVPVGFAGPLLLDNKKYQVPMATTEGCLIASTNRGCRALASAGGVSSCVNDSGMTRSPVVKFPCAKRASEAKLWMEDRDNFELLAEAFNSTTRFGKLKKVKIAQAANNLYIRFVAFTGDAMGMNMVSKGCEKTLTMLHDDWFPDMEVTSLSGNYCTDKKPAAINWIEGRGKSVVCDAIIPSRIVSSLLKTTVHDLCALNTSKNLVGSAMAGSIGGNNAHSANIVTAIYIATGQDPAQNIASSNCMTIIEPRGPNGEDLYISCSMPSIEVGTIGGGTVLPPQASCLDMLGVRGSSKETPGQNSDQLARVVCATVMAGELSLMSALATGTLVKSHLKHNRSFINSGSASHASMSQLPPILPPMEKRPEPGTCIQNAP